MKKRARHIQLPTVSTSEPVVPVPQQRVLPTVLLAENARHIRVPSAVSAPPRPPESNEKQGEENFVHYFAREMEVFLKSATQQEGKNPLFRLWCSTSTSSFQSDRLIELYTKYLKKRKPIPPEQGGIRQVFMALWFLGSISALDMFFLAILYRAIEEYLEIQSSFVSQSVFVHVFLSAVFVDSPAENPVVVLAETKGTSFFSRYLTNVLQTEDQREEDIYSTEKNATLMEEIRNALETGISVSPLLYSLRGQEYMVGVGEKSVMLLETYCPTCSIALSINMFDVENTNLNDRPGIMTIQKIAGLPTSKPRPALDDLFHPQNFPFSNTLGLDNLDDIFEAYQRISRLMNYNTTSNAILDLFIHSYVNGNILGPDLAHYQQLPLRELAYFFSLEWFVTFVHVTVLGDKNIEKYYIEKSKDVIYDCFEVYRASHQEEEKEKK